MRTRASLLINWLLTEIDVEIQQALRRSVNPWTVSCRLDALVLDVKRRAYGQLSPCLLPPPPPGSTMTGLLLGKGKFESDDAPQRGSGNVPLKHVVSFSLVPSAAVQSTRSGRCRRRYGGGSFVRQRSCGIGQPLFRQSGSVLRQATWTAVWVRRGKDAIQLALERDSLTLMTLTLLASSDPFGLAEPMRWCDNARWKRIQHACASSLPHMAFRSLSTRRPCWNLCGFDVDADAKHGQGFATQGLDLCQRALPLLDRSVCGCVWTGHRIRRQGGMRQVRPHVSTVARDSSPRCDRSGTLSVVRMCYSGYHSARCV